ncbi:MAG: putative S-layer protein [archaeon]
MKTKIFTLLTAGIFALVLLTSFASAIVTFSNVPTLSQTGTSFTITATSDVNESVTFSATQIIDSTGKLITFTPTSEALIENTPTTIIINYNVQTGFNFEFEKPYSTTLSASTGGSQLVSFAKNTGFCIFDGNEYSNLNDDLEMEIRNINVKSGFGKDEEWLLFDEIEVELRVKNENDDYKIRDISVEWGIYNSETGGWVIEVDEEEEIDLKKNTDETIILSFKLDDELDEDLEEIANGNLVLYVRATGEVDDDAGEYFACASDFDSTISVEDESDFVILNNIQFPEVNRCGDEMRITAEVWNIGDNEQDDVSVRIYNSELGIDKVFKIGDMDEFDDAKLDVLIKIPANAKEKSYNLVFEVRDEYNDVYESNFKDKKSVFERELRIEGGCAVNAKALISASVESGGKAGGELIIKATVTNTGDATATYVLSAAGYTSWASSSASQNTFTLDKGQSRELFYTFNVKEDVSGEQIFNFELMSGTELVLTQPVSVLIEESSSRGYFSGITGAAISENAWLWGIAFLNIILVVVIIFVAVRIARK